MSKQSVVKSTVKHAIRTTSNRTITDGTRKILGKSLLSIVVIAALKAFASQQIKKV